MSKVRDDKTVTNTTTPFSGCCQTTSVHTTPENSISEDSIEEFDDGAANNNTMFHTHQFDDTNGGGGIGGRDANIDATNNLCFGTMDKNFPRRKTVDVEFQNIKYNVRKFSFRQRKFEKKEILHGINGAFRSGQLTAIMGPSGAGKSTLLNILAGYVETGVTGTVTVNGKNRSSNSQSFRNISAYIHQDDALRPYLTVGEAMTVATHLKLGFRVTKEYKKNLIQHILVLLGLEKRYHVYCGLLSGGQKKRLAIALELISNPPVIFLDEPTTGLDSSSCTRCISLLKRLAQEGRTIVCTIHTPSALIFEMFDKLYAITEGNCLYQGPTKDLVPFFADHGIQCPSYHNPADFLMEVAIGEYDIDLTKMMGTALKKYYEERDAHSLGLVAAENLIRHHDDVDLTMDGDIKKVSVYEFGAINNNDALELSNIKGKMVTTATAPAALNKQTMAARCEAASMVMQFFLLFQRNVTASLRNSFLIFARIFAHIFIASIFGYLYINVGSSATSVFGNYVYLYGTILLIVYTGKMAVVMSFPLEMEILRREHFNRWYNLGPYYLSIISFEIPFQMVCASLYVLCSYWLTGNYTESYRFFYFLLLCLMVTICAQSWGFFVGATMPVKIAVFIGPILAVLFSVFGFCTRYEDITPMFSWMWHVSYFRAGFHGVIDTVYGMNRPFLNCPESAMYCHFKNPKLFLNEVSINEINSTDNIVLMGSVIVVMHILTIIALWFKLNKR